MRRPRLVGVFVLAAAALAGRGETAPPKRPLLGPHERAAVLALVNAVDLAQATDSASEAGLAWQHHVLKSANDTAYVRFTLTPAAAAFKATAMYVRAVSRHDGLRSSSEHSMLRDWLMEGRDVMPRQSETMIVGVGEMPTAGLAGASGKQATAAAAMASAVLSQQQKGLERQHRAEAEARRRSDARQRDPLLFPFEEYFFFDLSGATSVERALALPPGGYDVYQALTVGNYGAPDSDLAANYTFYRVDGERRLFNRTDPQLFGDAELPPAGAWESQAFASQTVPLQPFPPGRYELEVTVRDRLTRANAKATVAFTVVSGLR